MHWADVDAPTLKKESSHVVRDLLAAIDQSARTGLKELGQKTPDLETANHAAKQAAARIEHLLSITAMPDDTVASLPSFAHDADLALGRAEQLANELVVHHGDAESLKTSLANVAVELAPAAKWKWRPHGLAGEKVGNGLTRKEGVRIGTGTLSMIAHRARHGAMAKDAKPVLAAATACAEDLQHAIRELALAANTPELKSSLLEDVIKTGEALSALEATAFRLSVGERSEVNAMRNAETQLRALVGMSTPRPFWDSAVPTLNAIVEIVSNAHVVKDGVGHSKAHPADHKEVPARYRALLDEWLLITHGSVRQGDGSKVEIRGRVLAQHLDHAIAQTMALINLIQREADPNTLDILDAFWPKVEEFHKRATSETVHDAIEEKASGPHVRGASAIDQLSEDDQIKVAAARMITVARTLTSSAQRLASTGHKTEDLALKTFKQNVGNAGLPELLEKEVSQAKSIADVASHISGLANGIQAVINIANPEQRRRVFETEFKKHGYGGVVEVGKTLAQLVQGATAVCGLAGYALLKAGGAPVNAANFFAAASKTIGHLSTAINVLNLVHGGLLIWNGDGAEKVDGAVEALWGALGLVGKVAPRFARFTGPLSAAVLIGWTTIKWIGEQTMGALYGMIQLGLNQAFEDMKSHAREIHGEATRLAIAFEMGDRFKGDAEQLAEWKKQVADQVIMLRNSIASYVARAQHGSRDSDPGKWKPLRTRFKPMVGTKMDTELDVLLAAEQLLNIAVACFQNAPVILEEAVQDALEEHGRANQDRF